MIVTHDGGESICTSLPRCGGFILANIVYLTENVVYGKHSTIKNVDTSRYERPKKKIIIARRYAQALTSVVQESQNQSQGIRGLPLAFATRDIGTMATMYTFYFEYSVGKEKNACRYGDHDMYSLNSRSSVSNVRGTEVDLSDCSRLLRSKRREYYL